MSVPHEIASEASIIPHGKRKILVVEDNELNRSVLGVILQDDYDLMYAENGQVGLDLLRRHVHDLSLVLLDINMPVCTGFQFLQQQQRDKLLSSVPVIVTTGSEKAQDEVRCLQLGAADFITKPYNPAIVRARIHGIIKMMKSITTLSVVESDELTKLYTIQAFYHHAAQLLKDGTDTSYDLCIMDIQDFKLINSILGEKKGDEILRNIAGCIQEVMPKALLARQGDVFYAMYDTRLRFDLTRENPGMNALRDIFSGYNMRAKWAIYENVDKSMSITTLCDRTLTAISSIKRDPNRGLAVYDAELQQKLQSDQRMEMQFEDALKNDEFVVWFQPKVNTQTRQICGAEALVRWLSGDQRLIPPMSFIPLFERSGLISKLDEYVFRTVCRFQKERLAAGKKVIPVSVNLSRNSIYLSDTVQKYAQIVEDEGIPMSLVPIELTESAAMEVQQMLKQTQHLKRMGFSLHMDDFGKGYSSISQLASMPLDVLKIDKTMIDHIGSPKGEAVISSIVSLARLLGMKTVAEGVETDEQVRFLHSVGCEQMQGYYFSPPKEQSIFENMLDQMR